ncbi:unnamed protein product [Hymenolepis diminuta]|uniref:Multidrug resistance protein 1 n=1 Tax=Hymenolepis diminuta TaxID=6216 RepID=A0A158QF54_HYMDI|nr:unnamed protein product [Hymenolepis diminuta]
MKYASMDEILLLSLGILMSCGVGSSMPITFFVFSDLVNDFLGLIIGGNFSFLPIIHNFAIIGAATFLVGFIQMFCLQSNAKLQARKIRLLLYKVIRILAQDVAWFDEQTVGGLITKLTENINKIEAGIGEKLGIFIQCIIIFVSGLIIAFTKNWKLALVGCAVFPPIAIGFGVLGYVVRKYTNRSIKSYERANSIASEALGAIRTIFAFEGQKSEQKRYVSELDDAEKCGIKMSVILGMSEAFIYILIAITFYYGIVLLNEGESNAVFTMLIGAITIGQALSQIDSFNIAMTSAGEIFPIIDRIPPINKSGGGTVLDTLKGEITFKNVHFSYPTRRAAKVLNGLTLTIKGGQTVAIIGASGSGKSTVIQLIQRFYDADDGSVLVDGHDIRELDIAWFREQMGVVSQEPVLFAGTVTENIRLGAPDATMEEIEEAAKQALVHEFVCKLPDGYDTYIAEGGGAMSGGQKQRLAIARALVRKPKILLLDEATSALDTRSEKSVQRALDNAKIGRTVVMVAHRLSTVRDADVIIVVNKGVVVEAGNHDELMALEDGHYAKLIKISVTEKKQISKEIMKMNAPELPYIIAGMVLSIISGGVQASFAILVTEIYDGYLWGVAGARLTKRCRVVLFESILRQASVGFFDDTNNQPGALTGCLAADAPTLQNISGRRFASFLEVITLIIVALVIAFVYSWQIALVALAFFPVLMVVGAFEVNLTSAFITLDSYILITFEHADFIIKLFDFFLSRAYSAITFSAQQLGYVAAFAPDSKKAQESGGRIFRIINRNPDLSVDDGDFPDTPFKGSVTFKNVHFRYPTRKKVKVLQGFDYSVATGTSVALVGQSGCGKSTVLQLVQRFYDPTQRSPATSGCILFDNKDLKDLAPTWIRRQIGVVSQEPNLLDLTIAENIAYGLTYEETPPSMDQIIEAAKQANAHEFISNLPLGYETPVGPRGSRLSGGQKQRVAIARALIRTPRLLVLDEATAALDNESERIVQAALDEAMKRGDRTTLVVAHRLTTVENCNSIVVLENGRCVESGSPAALMEAKGAYYSLHNTDAKTKIH